MPNWWHPNARSESLLDTLSDQIRQLEARNAGSVPSLRTTDHLLVASDYSGQHKSSTFETMSLLFANWKTIGKWNAARLSVRRAYLGNRRLSYKALNDVQKQKALRPFLDAAELVDGLLLTVAISRRVVSVYEPIGAVQLRSEEFAEYQHWSAPLLERALRVINLFALGIRGLAGDGVKVNWAMDDDDIIVPKRRDEFGRLVRSIVATEIPGKIKELSVRPTSADDESQITEDLAAIPDLAAGSMAAALTQVNLEMLAEGNNEVRVEGPVTKERWLSHWCCNPGSGLCRICIVVDRSREHTMTVYTPRFTLG